MARQTVYVEIDPKTELPIRIFKHFSEAAKLDPEVIRQMARSVAVGYIRVQVFERAKRGILVLCHFCGGIISPGTGHMHEVVPKGNGGEVSLDNCVAICSRCHIGPDGEHGDRKWGGKDAGRDSGIR